MHYSVMPGMVITVNCVLIKGKLFAVAACVEANCGPTQSNTYLHTKKLVIMCIFVDTLHSHNLA